MSIPLQSTKESEECTCQDLTFGGARHVDCTFHFSLGFSLPLASSHMEKPTQTNATHCMHVLLSIYKCDPPTCECGKLRQTLDPCLMQCPLSTYCTPKELFNMSDNAESWLQFWSDKLLLSPYRQLVQPLQLSLKMA